VNRRQRGVHVGRQRAIVEGRRSRVDAATTANWTAPGICAHASAMRGGARVEIPGFV